MGTRLLNSWAQRVTYLMRSSACQLSERPREALSNLAIQMALFFLCVPRMGKAGGGQDKGREKGAEIWEAGLLFGSPAWTELRWLRLGLQLRAPITASSSLPATSLGLSRPLPSTASVHDSVPVSHALSLFPSSFLYLSASRPVRFFSLCLSLSL